MKYPSTAKTIALVAFLSVAGFAVAQHPQILVEADQKKKLTEKIDQYPWAAQKLQEVRRRIEPFLEKVTADPEYLTSRLAMNWQTHYKTPVTAASRTTGGEGRAPVPTPRFGGSRNWTTDWTPPDRIEDLKPFNDQNGFIYLYNQKTKQFGWVEPGDTGRSIEMINERLMSLARDAGFLYWVTGEERYAKLAADLVWTYLIGFSHVTPPRVPLTDTEVQRIIGSTSFEVIHETIAEHLALAYDFVYDYMKAHPSYDVKLIQSELKRMADRVVAGGFGIGNWNLHQSRIIAVVGLALESNQMYEDGRGRGYYIDVVLNAQLPRQTGLTHVLKTDIDPKTAVWPEAAGYAFASVKNLTFIAAVLGSDTRGKVLLAEPLLTRAALVQPQLVYPHGFSNGVGDTPNEPVDTSTLELLIAAARDRGDTPSERRFTAVLQREIAGKRYQRGSGIDAVFALTKYVGELSPADSGDALPPTFYNEPLNLLMMRDEGTSPKHAFAAALYGTAGGHAHANGLAMELFGAGQIVGPDAGPGTSYWDRDHIDYFTQPPAHNTVIVNARSTYPITGKDRQAMSLLAAEPASGAGPLCPGIRYATARFQYTQPVAANQQRTLALIRLDAQHAFFFDVFRSRITGKNAGSEEIHDYLYHSIGQSITLGTVPGDQPPTLSSSSALAGLEMLPGYRYFRNVRAATTSRPAVVRFAAQMPAGKPSTNLWLPDFTSRQIFLADAPPSRGSVTYLPADFVKLPTPTVLVRRKGDAWTVPFVGVYEAFDAASDMPAIRMVKPLPITGDQSGMVASGVSGELSGKPFSAILIQDADGRGLAKVGGTALDGNLGLALRMGERIEKLYLGSGRSIQAGEIALRSSKGEPIDAAIWRDGNGWRYSASGDLQVTIKQGKALKIYALPKGASLPVR